MLDYSEKIQTEGIEDILFLKKSLDLSLYPWKFQTKQNLLFLENFVKLCYAPWEFQGQKSRLMKVQHDFFLITPKNFTLTLGNS